MTGAAGTISDKLFAGLELRARERRTGCESEPWATAGLILVNGVHAAREQILRPDDEVALFPPLGGG